MWYRIPLVVLVLSLTPASPVNSLQLQNTSSRGEDDLIMLTVTVRNKAGNFVMGVPRQSFDLLDEKEARAIEFFENLDTPMSIGLLVDTSGSMQFFENKDLARAGPVGEMFSRFLELSNPANEYFVMAFDSTPRFLTDWKSGSELIAQKINLAPEKTNTALYDALLAGTDKFKSAHYSKRALIVVTDGQDNASRHTFIQLRESLRRSDISTYSLGIATPADVGSTLGMEGSGVLAEIAEVTGGEVIFPRDQKQMKQAIEALAIQLRHQYRLGFRPTQSSRPNQWHRLKLKVTARPNAPEEFSKLTVRSRPGYYTK